MDKLAFYLQWVGASAILYAVAQLLYHSHRFDEDRGCKSRWSGIRWGLYHILWFLAFPVTVVFNYLNKEHNELTRGIAVRDTRSEMYKEIKELREQIWMPLDQKKLKTHLFHQNLWRRTVLFCDAHEMPDTPEFRIHIFAALHLLVSDILQSAKMDEEMNRQLPIFINRIYDIFYEPSLSMGDNSLVPDTPNNARMKEIIGHHDLLFRIFSKSSCSPEDSAYIEDVLSQALTNAEIEASSDYFELHQCSEFRSEFRKLVLLVRTQGRSIFSLRAAPMPKAWTKGDNSQPNIRVYIGEPPVS